jgi:hypothetical protein
MAKENCRDPSTSPLLHAKNKFYSEAPLPTDMHIKFLEEFEADALAASKQ